MGQLWLKRKFMCLQFCWKIEDQKWVNFVQNVRLWAWIFPEKLRKKNGPILGKMQGYRLGPFPKKLRMKTVTNFCQKSRLVPWIYAKKLPITKWSISFAQKFVAMFLVSALAVGKNDLSAGQFEEDLNIIRSDQSFLRHDNWNKMQFKGT